MHAVGDGALRYAEVLAGGRGVDVVAPALSFPPPATLLAPGPGAAGGGANRQSSLRRVVPLYMREADAKSNFARARA